ncbi:hypothetical protein F5Y06DRAFT_26630 [Hypoxylon sp. FL0890]|nr:hypothetical protein F5Y06DRAFT_26630 [Hypoxylon sp. FL0890]
MWLLENEGEALDGKRLWLRPGKRYLFGRTVAEPGQLAIKGEGAERVSRKHVTIQVDEVAEGDGEIVSKHSRVTIEDLGSKGGTWVNEEKIKGERRVLSQDVNVLQMGSFASKFRITWFPVVLSFSFTAKEIQADPLSKLREDLEQLDIKFLAEFDQSTTHVVSRKRNVPKALQALVNGRYLVTPEFYASIIAAATPEDDSDGVAPSPLESDFDANWPDALQFVPPPGEEAVPWPVEAFAPNPNRAEVFHGYTFIFYHKKQFDNLLDPITNGGGKALLNEAVEGQTDIDDFIRFVKEVAGEKGLGEFEDGSEGKGVVVVRWIPDPPRDWFINFYNTVSQRLDQRLIEQREFLGAILNNDASGLRRPLEAEAAPRTSQVEPASTAQDAMEIEGDEPSAPPERPPPRRRVRGAVKSRFKGFSVALEDDDLPEAVPATSAPSGADAEESQEGLFVSQDAPPEEPEETIPITRQSQRKRHAPSASDAQDMMEDFAPTAAQVKRRRIAAGEEPVPREPTPVESSATETQKLKAKAPKVKKEIDILDVARQHREEAEARAKAEREELATAPEDLDLAEIRRLHIEEPMELRQAPPIRSREQDIADGRWDPAWNGRKNFKKFQQRGAVQGRPPQKIIVALEEVKSKGFGIGDDYWLEDESQRKKKKQSQTQSQSQSTGGRDDRQGANGRAKEPAKQKQKLSAEVLPLVDSSEDEDQNMDDEDDDVVIAPPPKTRSTRTSQQTLQSQSTRTTTQNTSQKTQPSRTGKRPAPPPAKEKPAKRSRIGFVAASDDESDDGLRFRFGKR